jgi:F0F1-type ATP synthase assembly protein I
MWQLLDIAYVIPACVFLGYWIGILLENQFSGTYRTPAIVFGAVLGFILAFVKIKRYVDSVNNSPKNPDNGKDSSRNELGGN